jgi:hypothetical protein
MAQIIDFDHLGITKVNGVCFTGAAGLLEVGRGVGSEVGGVETMARR